MDHVILVIHLILALGIIVLVMIQRSEGGGLGIGGGGGVGGLATAGQTANVLTRTTGIFAAGFFTTSLILAILAGASHRAPSVLDSLDNTTAPAQATGAPVTSPLDKTADPAAPATDLPTPRAEELPKLDGKATDAPAPTTTPAAPPSAPISE